MKPPEEHSKEFFSPQPLTRGLMDKLSFMWDTKKWHWTSYRYGRKILVYVENRKTGEIAVAGLPQDAHKYIKLMYPTRESCPTVADLIEQLRIEILGKDPPRYDPKDERRPRPDVLVATNYKKPPQIGYRPKDVGVNWGSSAD